MAYQHYFRCAVCGEQQTVVEENGEFCMGCGMSVSTFVEIDSPERRRLEQELEVERLRQYIRLLGFDPDEDAIKVVQAYRLGLAAYSHKEVGLIKCMVKVYSDKSRFSKEIGLPISPTKGLSLRFGTAERPMILTVQEVSVAIDTGEVKLFCGSIHSSAEELTALGFTFAPQDTARSNNG